MGRISIILFDLSGTTVYDETGHLQMGVDFLAMNHDVFPFKPITNN